MAVSRNSTTIIKNTYNINHVSGWYPPVIDIVDDVSELPVSAVSGDRYAINDSLIIAEFNGAQWNSGEVVDAGRFAVINENRFIYFRDDDIFSIDYGGGQSIEYITGLVEIPPESWGGDSAPFNTNIQFDYVNSHSIVTVSPLPEINNVYAVSDCMIMATGQSDDVIYFGALKSKPTTTVYLTTVILNIY